MVRRFLLFALVAAAVAVLAVSVSVASPGRPRIEHVLLISVDGLHQSDLDWFVAHHPSSELARLVRGGAEFSNAHTSVPSDSDPGGTALMTGGDPRATGAYYDMAYSHAVFPPGTTDCSGPAPGGNAIYDSPDDILNAVPDLLNNGSGTTFPSFDEDGSIYPGGVDTNPAAIMNLTPHPQSGLNPATFPVDPTSCQPIMPWDYLQVNTIFQAAARETCLGYLDRIPWFLDRQLWFQALARLHGAFSWFLLALHVKHRTYPIAYDKWIREQIVDNLSLPELYERLPALFEIGHLQDRELDEKAAHLRELAQTYLA